MVPQCPFRPTVHQLRDGDLPVCVQAVLNTWARNLAVVVHCRASYHRGPLAAAALARRLCNLELTAIWRTLSEARVIWPGFLHQQACHPHNFHSLVDGMRWVENITPDLGLWQDPSAMIQTQSRIDDAANQTCLRID